MATNNKQAAQLEKAQNLAIYNKVAEHARRAFARLVIRPGVYTPADIVKTKKQGTAFYTGDPDEVATVEVGAFSCSFSVARALDLLAKLANAYHIPTAARVTFERTEKQADELRAILEQEAEEQRQREEAERLERERIEAEARRARIIEEGEELNARTFAAEFANLYAIAPELPTANNQAETATPEDVPALTISESEPRDSRARVVIMTAARWLLRAAAVVAAVLLVTLTPEHTTTANASDISTSESQPAPAAVIADTLTAYTLTADTLEAITTATSHEQTARPSAPRKRHHKPAQATRESHKADTLTADTLTAYELTADTLKADTISTPATLEAAREISEQPTDQPTGDPLTVSTSDDDSESDTAAPADDDTANDDGTTAPTSGTATTATTGTPATMATPAPASAPVAPVAPILIL